MGDEVEGNVKDNSCEFPSTETGNTEGGADLKGKSHVLDAELQIWRGHCCPQAAGNASGQGEVKGSGRLGSHAPLGSNRSGGDLPGEILRTREESLGTPQ